MLSEIASSGTIYSQLWSFGTRALKSREVGLNEASDLLLSNHIAEKSVTVQFVNARLPSKRSRMLKKMSDLRKLNEIDPDSEDVFVPTLIEDHYPARPDSLNDMSLYDFLKHIAGITKITKMKKLSGDCRNPEFPIIHCLIPRDQTRQTTITIL